MTATYHTHTRWSDGEASTSVMAAEAERLGLEELGFSDHLALHPSGETPVWALPPEGLPGYVREVRGLETRSVEILLGLEVDWFPGRASVISETLAPLGLDYTIGSVHYADSDPESEPVDGGPGFWKGMSPAEAEAVYRRYWDRVREMAESRIFSVAGHLDLPKKHGPRPLPDMSGPIGRALDAVSAAGMAVELNTSGWHRPCEECYPSEAILRRCRERDIPVVLSSDAHRPDELVRDFDIAAALLRSVGYDRVVRPGRDGLRPAPLA